jgi:DNA-binding response OmpR family regulator
MARVVRTISDALRELRSQGYDAVFLRMEGAEELSLLLRIRSAAPEVPLCALIPDLDGNLERLARESGADLVLPAEREAERAAKSLRRALGTTEALIRRSRTLVARSVELRERSMELRAASHALRDEVFTLAEVPVEGLVPLLVEDDPDHAFFMKRSFDQNALPFPLPVLGNGEEAISYLAGKGRYHDRARYPLPTLLIVDLHLPRKDGFEVLRWVRSQPALSKLVVFILSSSPLPKDFETAITAGADFFYVKPVSLGILGRMAQVMAVRWSLLYKARGTPAAPPPRPISLEPERASGRAIGSLPEAPALA